VFEMPVHPARRVRWPPAILWRVNVCTIVDRGSLACVHVLTATLRRYHPDLSLTALLLDAEPDATAPIAGVRIVGLDSIAEEEGGLLAAANAPGALPMAVLPYLVSDVLRSGAPSVLYVNAGQRVLGPLTRLLDMLEKHSVALVTRAGPGNTTARAFADDPTRGLYSRHILAFGAGSPADDLLAAWPRCFRTAGDDGAAAVRRWLDGIPAFHQQVGVLRDPIFALDAWSLADLSASGADVRLDGEEGLNVGGRFARLLDLTELDPRSPAMWLGAGGVGPDLAPALGALVERHAEELLAAGWDADRRHPIPYQHLADGLRLTSTVRSLLGDAISERKVTCSPFTASGRAEFYEYLSQPGDRGRAAGLSRLHMAIWRARPDLRSGYRHLDGPDGAGFAGWLCVHGAEQEGLVPELLPPAPELAYRDADAHVQESQPRWGVNVVGFFTAELGVGEAARLLVAGLDADEIPALPIQGRLMPPSRQGSGFSYATPDEAAYPVNLLCINGDGIPVFAREAGRSFFEDRYSIALWWWEAGEPPTSWKEAYGFVDEVWVGSQYVYDLLAPVSPLPVVRIRLPVVEPEVAARTRSQLGLPEDGFLFLCVHDYHSVAARKNPVGVVEAYRRAFPEPSAPRLVLKSINAHTDPTEHARVLLAARDRPDITLIDDYASNSEKNAMIAAADCFVSLHRSEGFGIPLAEAMLLEKPVIATRYGGSLEFMTDENSYLVNWTSVAVGEGAYPYSPEAVWAEPDLDHAASLMRNVFESQAEARQKGQTARRDVLKRHSPAVAGAIMGQRLSIVHEMLAERGERSLNLAHLQPLGLGEHIRELIERPPEFDWNHDRLDRFKWSVYLPIVQWVRAYVAHQRTVDTETAVLFDRLDDRARRVAREARAELEAQHAETLAMLRRVEADLGDLRRASDS
jgi:glycosyltransferase involved in cell wall biosynthesis